MILPDPASGRQNGLRGGLRHTGERHLDLDLLVLVVHLAEHAAEHGQLAHGLLAHRAATEVGLEGRDLLGRQLLVEVGLDQLFGLAVHADVPFEMAFDSRIGFSFMRRALVPR